MEVRADINDAVMKVYVDGEYKEAVQLYSEYVEGNKTAYMISGLLEGKHLIRLEKVGGANLNINELIVYTRDIRIACVGDSLTWGAGATDNPYPLQLSALMGDGYDVRNFGKPGATLRDGDKRYSTLVEYTNSVAFLPDMVYIMLGTNDLKNRSGANLAKIDGSIAAYKDLISSYQALSSQPQIMLHTVPADSRP